MLTSNLQDQARKILEKCNYQTIRKIGKGAYGHVVLASKFTNSMKFYAVKCLNLKSNSKDANLKKYVQQEVNAMSNIDHPNVVRFETSFADSGWYFIVMQYCDMGNLLNYQSKATNKALGLSEASKILMQILNGIQKIHGQNIIHRDIKCQNIFLKKNKNGVGFRIKIGDFGFAKEVDEITRTSCGTTLFMAPQVLRKQVYGFPADVWSIGVVFYFMLFGDYPFKSINIEKQIQQKCENGFNLGDLYPCSKQKKQYFLIQDFFKRIFDLDQNRRIKLDQIIFHKLFKTGDGLGTSDSSFSQQQLEEQLEWNLGKIRFIQQLILQIGQVKTLDIVSIYACQFYLYKILMIILKSQNLTNIRNQIPKNKISLEIQQRENIIKNNLLKLYQILDKLKAETKKISKFEQGFSIDMQDFYAIKQGYRNTLSIVYFQIQKKVINESLKSQIKFKILCCHLINRVFNKGINKQVFPNFNAWIKKYYKEELKRQHQFSKLKQWLQLESPQKIVAQIQNINKKFYS